MFSKSLFKQSCKANGIMWAIITFAVCFMLACVMLISGNSTLSSSKNAFQNTIIEGELTSQLQARGLNYYVMENNLLEKYDTIYVKQGEIVKGLDLTTDPMFEIAKGKAINTLKEGIKKEHPELDDSIVQQQAQQAYEADKGFIKTSTESNYRIQLVKLYSLQELMDGPVKDVIKAQGYDPEDYESQGGQEIRGLILAAINPDIPEIPNGPEELEVLRQAMDQIRGFYKEEGKKIPDYKRIMDESEVGSEKRKNYIDEFAAESSSMFMAVNLIQEDNINMILNELTKYGVSLEDYHKFGLDEYDKVHEIATGALINFRANYEYRIESYDGEVTEEVKAQIADDLGKEVSKSLLSSLPTEISEALEELGQADLYGTLVGSIFFKMAGLLLPIIYMIMTSNSLIAGQVDSGSMAYILSTSVKRRTVTFTQATYLIGSLFAMFTCTAITSVICFACVDVETSLTYGKLLLINLGAFIVMFAMSGICFLASCFFNRSKHSMAIGGGLNMFFLVATMLGLFGSQVLPKLIRMDALNAFNYVSIISLFDVISILEGGYAYIWKFAILIGIGTLCYVLGSEKFAKKDLPL